MRAADHALGGAAPGILALPWPLARTTEDPLAPSLRRGPPIPPWGGLPLHYPFSWRGGSPAAVLEPSRASFTAPRRDLASLLPGEKLSIGRRRNTGTGMSWPGSPPCMLSLQGRPLLRLDGFFFHCLAPWRSSRGISSMDQVPQGAPGCLQGRGQAGELLLRE